MINGVVKSYSDYKGYGFITGENSKDYFAHVSKIVGTEERTLNVGDKVTFIAHENYKGGYAAEIRIITHKINDSQNHAFQLKKNPFTPQTPIVDANKFAGRREAIYSSIDSLFNNKNLLISGPRGIGKSSLSYQLLYTTNGEEDLLIRCGIEEKGLFNNIICDYRCMPGNDINDIASGLISSLCTRLDIDLVDGKSETIGIDLTVLNYSHTEEHSKPLTTDILAAFAFQIEKIFKQDRAGYVGITFLIDEIDILDPEIEIAAFLKGAVEKFSLDNYKSFYFIVSGITGTITNLISQHPSAGRLFENIILSPLGDEELHDLLGIHLEGTGVSATETAISQIISYSNNFPQPVQLIGYHAFRCDSDNNIDKDDVESAVKYIVKNLKRQEFDIKFDKLCKGRNVEILRVMVQSKFPTISITYIERCSGIDYQEVAGILGDFIRKGIVEKSFRNQYRFVEPLFPIYLKMTFDIS